MNRLIAWFMAGFLWVMMVTPAWLSYRFATGMAWILTPIFMIVGRRTKPTRTSLRRNFQIAYGKDLSESEIRALTYRLLRHAGWLIVDFARIPLIKAEDLADAVSPEDMKLLRELVAEGKGVLGVGGHVGVFTLLGHLGGLLGLPLYTISTPRKNPHLQKLLHDRQTGYGQKNIDERGVAVLLKEVLTDGDMLGLLVDEEAKRSDTFLPFLGTLATTNPLAARLHLMTGAPICVVCVHRTGPARYRVRIMGVIRREKGEPAKRKQLQREIMQEINQLIEESIRVDPAQWLWSSRRWRTRPPDEAPSPDGIPPRVAPPILPDFIEQARAVSAGAKAAAETNGRRGTPAEPIEEPGARDEAER